MTHCRVIAVCNNVLVGHMSFGNVANELYEYIVENGYVDGLDGSES